MASLTSKIFSEKDCIVQLAEIRDVLKDELSRCMTAKEVQKFLATANRVLNSASSDSLGVSGRVAYRLREALRDLRRSNFAALDTHHLLPIQRALNLEAARRKAQLKLGDSIVVTSTELPPLLGQDGAKPVLQPIAIPSKTKRPTHDIRVTKAQPEAEMVPLKSLGVRSMPLAEGFHEQAVSCGKAHASGSSGLLPMPAHRDRHDVPPSVAASGSSGHIPMPFQRDRHLLSPSVHASEDLDDLHRGGKDTSSLCLWRSAFRKFRDDGQVHHDSIAGALEFIGFKPDLNLLEPAFSEVSGGYSTLAEDELVAFFESYTRRMDHNVDKAFEKADHKSSGFIGHAELRELLASFGICPMSHVLEEMVHSCGVTRKGVVNLKEFKEGIHLLRAREGFTEGEAEHFGHLFRRCDKDGTGELNASELEAVLGWLGYALDRQGVQAILKQIDFTSNSALGFAEFLMCMRKVREYEMEKLKEVVADIDEEGLVKLDYAELPEALEALGYVTPDRQAIFDAATEAGLDPNDLQIDLSQLWKMLTVYRAKEGFSTAECEDIKASFTLYSQDGHIGTLEVGAALRRLGYSLNLDLTQQLFARVDLDMSGSLNLSEFRKLIRMYQGQNFLNLSAVVSSATQNGCWTSEDKADLLMASGCIQLVEAQEALKNIQSTCIDPDASEVASALRQLTTQQDSFTVQQEVDTQAVVKAMIWCQKARRDSIRANGGFSALEMQDMQQKFDKWDRDSSGDINDGELAPLLQDCFPDISWNVGKRSMITKIVSEMEILNHGHYDFSEFVKLMIHVIEVQLQDRLERERRAIAATKFTHKEVEEFRELFLSTSEAQTTLQIGALVRLLQKICPLGDRNMSELHRIIREVLTLEDDRHMSSEMQGRARETREVKKIDRVDDEVEVEFPEFVMLVHRLIEVNFAGMREVANRVAK